MCYITFDRSTSTVVIVFAQNFVLTVNLGEVKVQHEGTCPCPSHLSITNFSLADIEAQYAIDFKRVILG